jgi:O-antigen/teichoic acid export membrane protein
MTTAPAEPIDRFRRLFSQASRAASSRAGSSILAVIDQAIFSGTNFAAVLLIANYAAPEQLGVWQMAMTVVLLGYFVQDALILAPYRVHYHARPLEERPAYFGSALLHQAGLVIALQFALFLFVAAVHLAAPQIEYEGVFAVLAALFPFILARDAARRMAMVHFQNGTAAIVDATTAALLLGGLVLVFEFGSFDLQYAMVLLGIASAAGAGLWFLIQNVPFSLSAAKWRADWVTNWVFGRWTLASMLVSNGATLLLMPWALAFAKGEAVTGEFAAATGVAGVTNLFVNGFGNFLGPHFAKVYAHEGRAGLAKAIVVPTILFGVGLGGATVAAIFLAEPVAQVLFSGKYPGVGRPIAYLFGNSWMLGLGIVASASLYAMHRPRANFLSDCVNLVAAVVAMILLIEPWGATGAAASYLTGTIFGSSTRWLAFLIALSRPEAGASAKDPRESEGPASLSTEGTR